MTETWPEIVAADLAAGSLGTVLMLGSGGEALLERLPQAATARVIRAEPDPRRARTLQRRHASDASVTVLPVAVAETTGTARLRRFNLSQATSFRAPTGLMTLFPGLCETGQAEVETQTVTAIVEEAGLDREADHVLILGFAGEELAVIGQLADLGLLQRFAHVIVPLPGLALYEGAGDGRQIRARLEEAGFRIESRDMSDPDLAFAHLRLDRAQVALTAERDRLREAQEMAQAEIERLKAERDGAASDRDAAQEGRTAAERKAAAQQEEIARLKEAAREAQETAQAEIERLKALRAQTASARDTAEKGRTEAEQKAAAQQEEIARLQQSLKARSSELEKNRAELEACNRKVADMSETMNDCTARLQKLQHEHGQIKSENDALTKSFKTLEQTLKTKDNHIQELEVRDSKAREELRRVEGQVELIKSLLLRAGD